MNTICQQCGDDCEIDGEYPKYFAWCDICNNYAVGFDEHEYANDYLSTKIDEAKDRRKYG